MPEFRKPQPDKTSPSVFDRITNVTLAATVSLGTLQALASLSGAPTGLGGMLVSGITGCLAVKFGRKLVDTAFDRFQKAPDAAAKAPDLAAEFEALSKGNFIKGVVERSTTAVAQNERTGTVSRTDVSTAWYVRKDGESKFTRMDDKDMRAFERELAKTPGATLNKVVVDGAAVSLLRYTADDHGNLKLHGDTPEAPAKVIVTAGNRKTVEFRTMGVDVTGDVLAHQPAVDTPAAAVPDKAEPRDPNMGPWGPYRA